MGKIALFVKNNYPEAIFDFFCTKNICTPDSLPHSWGYCDMGGIAEVNMFFPSSCNIGPKNNLFPKIDLNLKKQTNGCVQKTQIF